MPRRKRRNWPFLIAIFAVAALLLVYVLGWPLVSAVLAPAQGLVKRPRPFLVPLAEQIPIRLFEFVIFAWLFVFGSCLGSFLNVVIYRVPRGFSLWGSSHCPFCRVRIPPRDNVPVFGWLALRGRCRTCRLPISPRYPLVELAVGLVALILSMLEILLAGINLPGSGERMFAGMSVSWLVGHPRWDLIGTCLLHSGLVCVLLSWALIRYDGYAIPPRYLALALMAGLLLTAVTPALGPEASHFGSWDWQPWLQDWVSGGRGLAGLGGGLLVALIVAAGCRLAGVGPSSSCRGTLPNALAGFGLVGVCLGWRAAASIGLLTAAAKFLGALTLGVWPTRRSTPLLAYACPAAFVQICLWRWLDGLVFWPSSAAGPATFVAAATMMLVLAWQAGVLERLSARAAGHSDQSAEPPDAGAKSVSLDPATRIREEK